MGQEVVWQMPPAPPTLTVLIVMHHFMCSFLVCVFQNIAPIPKIVENGTPDPSCTDNLFSQTPPPTFSLKISKVPLNTLMVIM